MPDTTPTAPPSAARATLSDTTPAGRPLPVRMAKAAVRFVRGLGRLLGTLFTIGLSLLPLAALLVALPAVAPNEAVLSDTVRPAKSWARRTARRVFALFAGLAVLVALLAFSIEVVSHLPTPEGGQLGTLAKKVLGYSAADFVPDDPKPIDAPPLAPLLEERKAALKVKVESDDAAAARAAAADVTRVDREIADWGRRPENVWMIQGDPSKPPASESEVADQVLKVTGRWLPAGELLFRRFTLQKALARQNLTVEEERDARRNLAEVEKEIEFRTPISPKLRLMLNPEYAPVLAVPLWQLMPPTLVNQWPFVLLVMYATDLGLLLLIGRVPLAYNFRYLWVRKRDTALTALAFTVVVALVVVLLAFVNGMYKLNESTGVPGNVLVLSEGSTDELFSNLTRGGETDNIVRAVVAADARGRPIGPGGKGVGVARVAPGPDGKLTRLPLDTPKDKPGATYLASYESFLVMNQAVPTKPGEAERRRFLQLRAFQDPQVGAAVHNIELEKGGAWFTSNAVDPGPKAPDGLEYLQCVIGDGAAATLGEDQGKPRLAVGDGFELGERWWKVVGVMGTRGTTYGSEIWTGVENPVVRATGKGDKFTTLVLRMEDDSDESARAMANYLNTVQKQVTVKAFSEPDYYKELTKTNEQFLTAIVFMALIMAVGGVFGVMNTMFASIAARIKEVGVLRILGFKRWQLLISFMIESLAIGLVGGLLGCLLGYLANGFEAASTLSGGQGGGKSVTLTMMVDTQILAAGLLFTLVMSRLGGLVPAMSAMRMEILESLR